MSVVQFVTANRIRTGITAAVGSVSAALPTGFAVGRFGDGDGLTGEFSRVMYALIGLVALIALGQVLDVSTEV